MKIGFPQNITSKSSGYAPDWPNSNFQWIYTRKTAKLTGLWWISPGENFLNKNFYLKIWTFFCRLPFDIWRFGEAFDDESLVYDFLTQVRSEGCVSLIGGGGGSCESLMVGFG